MAFKSCVKKISGTLKHSHTHKVTRHIINTMLFAISAVALANKVMALYHGTKVYADRYNCQGKKLVNICVIRISILM